MKPNETMLGQAAQRMHPLVQARLAARIEADVAMAERRGLLDGLGEGLETVRRPLGPE